MYILLRRKNRPAKRSHSRREDASLRKSRKQAERGNQLRKKGYRGQFGERKEPVPHKASTEETPFQAKEQPEQLIRRLMKTQGIRSPFEAIHLLQRRGTQEAPPPEYFPEPTRPKRATSSSAYEIVPETAPPRKPEKTESPLEKFENYPPAMRAIIYSEILGKPKGLS